MFFFEPVIAASNAGAAPAGALSSLFFVDPGGRLTAELRKWLDLAWSMHMEGRSIPPLLINGLTKVGVCRVQRFTALTTGSMTG